MADDFYTSDFGGGGAAPIPTVTPRVTSGQDDFYSSDFGGGGGEPSPAMQKTVGDTEWSDYPKYAGSVISGMGAGLAAGAAGISRDPEKQKALEAQSGLYRTEQQAGVESMTPAGQQAAEAPLFSGQTWRRPGQAAAFGGIGLGLTVAPYAIAGAIGGPPAMAAYGAAQTYGDVRSNVTDAVMNAPESKLEGFDPDYQMVRSQTSEQEARQWLANKVLSTTGADKWGAVAGALLGGAGGVEFGGALSKVGVGPAEQLALGATRGAVEMGVPGAIQYGATQHATAQAGVNEEPTGTEILGAGVEQGVVGAAFAGGHSLLGSGWQRNLTQKPGEAGVARENPAAREEQAKPRAPAEEAPATQPAGGRQPDDPVADPDIAAATGGEPTVDVRVAKGVTIRIPKAEHDASVAQLKEGEVTPQSKQPPVVQPPTVQPVVETAQDQQGRSSVGIEPAQGVPPQPPPESQPAPAPVKPVPPPEPAPHPDFDAMMAGDRAGIVYPKGEGLPSAKPDTIGQTKLASGDVVFYDKGQTTYQAVHRANRAGALDDLLAGKSRVEAVQPTPVESVAGEKPAVAEEGPKEAATAVAPEVTPRVTPEAPVDPRANMEKLAENPHGVAIYRDADGKLWKQGIVKDDFKPVTEVTAKILFPKVFGEAEPVEPTGRVIRAEPATQAGKELLREGAVKQSSAIAENLKKIGQKEEGAKAPSTAGRKGSTKEMDKRDADRAAADQIIRDHPAPEQLGPSWATDTFKRAKAIVAAAKKAKIDIPDDFREGHPHNGAMLKLREAMDLIAKGDPRNEDYGRFMTRENLIDTGREEEAFADRRSEGREAGALGAPEGAIETRPGEEGQAEVSPEEEHIRQEEEKPEEKGAGVRETSPGTWRATIDGKVLGDSRGYRSRSEALAEAERMEKQNVLANRVREEETAKYEASKRMTEEAAAPKHDIVGEKLERERLARARVPQKEEGEATPKLAAEFKVEKRRTFKKQEMVGPEAYLGGADNNRKLETHELQAMSDAGWDIKEIRKLTPEEARERLAKALDDPDVVKKIEKAGGIVTKGQYEDSPHEVVYPVRTTDAATAIKESYKRGDYLGALGRFPNMLRDLIVKIAGDIPVHFVTDEDMTRITGPQNYGAYSSDAVNGKPVIFLNIDHTTPDTALHEAFHGATDISIENHPELQDLMERLRVEVRKSIEVKGLSKAEYREIEYYLSSYKEFLTGMMTNPKMQELLRGVKISQKLAKDIGIPLWRKMTTWEGALSIIRSALGLGARDTSAIEAAMALTEHTIWRDPRGAGEAMQAAGRMAKTQMEGWKLQKAIEKTPVDASRSPTRYNETMDKITDMVKERIKDAPALGHTVTETMRKWIDTPRDWMERAKERGWRIAGHAERIIDHMGELGADREKILKLSTPVMDRLGRLYAENGEEFGKLARLFVSSTVHGADARHDLGQGLNEHIKVNKKKPENSSVEHFDAIRGNPKDRIEYKALSPDAQKLYDDTMDELKKMNTRTIEALRQSLAGKLQREMDTSGVSQDLKDAVQKVIDKEELTPEELEKHGDDANIEALKSYDAMVARSKLGAYFPLKRMEGTHYVGGEHEYELPSGASRASNDESSPDYHRIIFDTRKEAFNFDPDLPSSTEIKHYIEDPSGKREYVSADEATSTPGAKSGEEYHVLVNNRDVRYTDGYVEGQRIARQMEQEGMKNVTVQPRKNKDVFQYGVNSGHVTSIIRRLNKMDLTDDERTNMADAIRHVAASSMPGSRLSRAFLHRDRTGGAGGDIIASLDRHRRTSAGLEAMAGHRDEIDTALEKMKQYVDDHPGHKDAGDMRQMVNMYDDRVNNFQKYELSDINVNRRWNAVRAYTTLNDLVSPAFFLLHQLHLPLTVYPALAAEHGIGTATRITLGVMKDMARAEIPMAAKAMGRALTRAWRYDHKPTDFIDALKNEGKISADERSMIDWGVAHDFAHSTGIDFSQAYVSPKLLDKFASKARNFSQEFIGSADAFNKVNSALMFHRAALEKGMKGEEAYRYAWDSVARTQGQFTSFQRMGMFRDARMQSVFQYKQYPILMAKTIAKAMYNSFAPGVEWETRARALRTFGLMTLSAGTMSGVQGGTAYPIRMADDLLHLLGLTEGWETHMDELRRGLYSSMGETGATAIMDGLGGLAGIYAGHRGGISDPLGINYLLETAKGDQEWYKYLAGPPGGLAHNLITGIGGLMQGDTDVAVKNLLPRIATDPIKAFEEYNHGVSTQRGAIISPPVSALSAVYKALGLTTTEETHARELRAAVGRERADEQTARQRITKLWQGGDKAGAIAAVHKFNMAYPHTHISVASLTKLGERPTVAGYPETPKNRAQLEERARAYGLQ